MISRRISTGRARGKYEHHGVNQIVGKVEKGFQFFKKGCPGSKNSGEQFESRLDGTLGPSELLAFKGIHVFRDFRGNHNIGQKDGFPSFQLDTVGKIHVLGQGIPFPTSPIHNRLLFPEPGCSVEIHIKTAPITGGLFYHEVTVDSDGLHAGEKRTVAIEMSPARLGKPQTVVIQEEGNRLS